MSPVGKMAPRGGKVTRALNQKRGDASRRITDSEDALPVPAAWARALTLTRRAPADPTPVISHLALSPHPTSWLSDVIYFLTAAFPQVPGTAARWRARRHGVTTLPALADYHERPRCTLTTRRAGDRTGMLAESHSLGETAGRRLFVASRGSYDKAGYAGMG